MNDKYSIEQIKSAIDMFMRNEMDERSKELLIAELTRPQWKPQEGEVFSYSCAGILNYYKHTLNNSLDATCRPLTPSEVPALKVAIECLEYAEGWKFNHVGACSRALAKIKKLTND